MFTILMYLLVDRIVKGAIAKITPGKQIKVIVNEKKIYKNSNLISLKVANILIDFLFESVYSFSILLALLYSLVFVKAKNENRVEAKTDSTTNQMIAKFKTGLVLKVIKIVLMMLRIRLKIGWHVNRIST